MSRFGVGVAASVGAVVGLFAGMLAGKLVSDRQGYSGEEEAYWRLGLATAGAAAGAAVLGGLSVPAAVPQVASTSTTGG